MDVVLKEFCINKVYFFEIDGCSCFNQKGFYFNQNSFEIKDFIRTKHNEGLYFNKEL
jgi:hypothetical protein